MLDNFNDERSPPSLSLNNRQQQCASPASVHSISTSEEGSDSVLYNYNDLRRSLNGVDSDISSISPSPKLPHHHVARTRDSPSKFTINTRASASPRLSFRSTPDLSRSDTSLSMLSTTLSSDVMLTPHASNSDEQISEIFGDLSNVDAYVMTSPTQNRPPTPPCNLLNIPRSMSVKVRDNVPSPVHSCRLDMSEDSQMNDNTMDEEFSSDVENLTARACHFRNHSFTSVTTPRKHRCKGSRFMERSSSFSALGMRPELPSASKGPTSPLVSSHSITGSAMLTGNAHESSNVQWETRSECVIGNPRMTNTYTLPNKEQDQGHRLITPVTLHDLSMGKYNDTITNIRIIDCRSVEEYTAGHIINAINIPVPHTNGNKSRYVANVREALEKNFFPPTTDAQTTAIIFYCEFSSHRGPTGATTLKNLDSDKLKEQSSSFGSSARHYPQVYVLEGGYCSYFKTFTDDCFPRNYLPESVAHPRRPLVHTISSDSLPGRLQF